MWPFSRRKSAAADSPIAAEADLTDDPPAIDTTCSDAATGQAADAPSPDASKMPRPHRCNARVEDLVQAMVTWDYTGKIQPAWRLMRQCFKSQPGNEPTDPYLVIKDPAAYLDPTRLHSPRPNMER